MWRPTAEWHCAATATLCTRYCQTRFVMLLQLIYCGCMTDLVPYKKCHKIAFHLNRTQTHFLLLWSWHWPNDLDTWMWRRLSEDVPAYQYHNELCRSKFSKVTALQTDRHTDRGNRKHYHVTFAGDNNFTHSHWLVVPLDICSLTLSWNWGHFK